MNDAFLSLVFCSAVRSDAACVILAFGICYGISRFRNCHPSIRVGVVRAKTSVIPLLPLRILR